MLVKALGFIDLIGGVFLFVLAFGIGLPSFLLILFIILFGLKSLFIFSKDIASIFDIFACLVFLVSVWAILPTGLYVLAGFLVFQKGIFSFLS